MALLAVRVGPLDLANPVMAASGTFGYGTELAPFMDPGRLGAIVGKSISLEPREGNPPPRTVETPAGLLNSIGLQNPGLERFLEEKLPALRAFGTRVVVNIVGERVEDYVSLAGRLGEAEGVDALELNLSCPNVDRGLLFGSDPALTEEVVRASVVATRLPVIVKLTPNVTDILPYARASERAGAAAVSVANTYVGMALDWRSRRSRLARPTGGLSGPAIKPLVLRLVWQCRQGCGLPVIGVGGIATAEDALEYLVAGASAVQVGTATFADPAACARVLEGMGRLLDEAGVRDVNELVGSLRAAPAGRSPN
ncbi:MAG: dihydroorotate dehydrogenase [Planctomycetes bacterium]|nr:dihydroorotate dehydrogenase [Planctomycetota bacterium]